MAFKFPWSNLHELNLDWILDIVKTLKESNDEFNEKADYAVTTADEAKEIAEQAAQATIADGSITTAKLANGAVTNEKLGTGSVTSAKIQDGTIVNDDLQDGAVGTAKIADGAVTTIKIADGAVTTAKINNKSVNNDKLNVSVRFVSVENVTVNAGASLFQSIDISNNKSVARCICGISLAGATYTTINSYYINAALDTISVRVANTGTAAETITIGVYYL